jgi:RHS repeat-associated protein
MSTDLSTAGNRTSVQLNGGTPSITTYNLANQITNSGFSYDNAGNLTNDGTAAYTYDALSRTTARGSTTYGYNGDGTLVSQATGGVTTRYTQDLAAPLSQVLQTQVGAATRTDYIYGLNRLASLNGGVKTWYAADALGSVRRTVADAGVPLGIVNYDPWGTPESGTVPTFGFTGEIQDVGTGLVNLRARWYSTARGRFTSVDSFAGFSEDPQSLTPYVYVHDNPVNSIDPTGRWRWSNPTGPGSFHKVIEDKYMEDYDTTGQNIHLEYRVYKNELRPQWGRPIRYQKKPHINSSRQIDILRSDTGDVWEIEPINKRNDAVPQATNNVNLLRYWGIDGQNPVLYCDDCEEYNYNWNTVDWHLGNPANFTTQRIEFWELSPLGFQTILIAEATEPGAIIYRLERNDKVEATEVGLAAIAAAARLFQKAGRRQPQRRPQPAFEFCPGFPYVLIPMPAEPDTEPYLPDPLPTYPSFPGTGPVAPTPDPRSRVA